MSLRHIPIQLRLDWEDGEDEAAAIARWQEYILGCCSAVSGALGGQLPIKENRATAAGGLNLLIALAGETNSRLREITSSPADAPDAPVGSGSGLQVEVVGSLGALGEVGALNEYREEIQAGADLVNLDSREVGIAVRTAAGPLLLTGLTLAQVKILGPLFCKQVRITIAADGDA